MPARAIESFTVIGPDLRPVELVDEYLAWLTDASVRRTRSRRTRTTCARSGRSCRARPAVGSGRREELGEFAAWARRPAANVVVLAEEAARLSARTVNRMLSGWSASMSSRPATGRRWRRIWSSRRAVGRGGYKPFLHGIARTRPRGRAVRLPERAAAEDAVVGAGRGGDRLRRSGCVTGFCSRCWPATGMRIGQALGLRHEDVVAWERRIVIRAREGAPRAGAEQGRRRGRGAGRRRS